MVWTDTELGDGEEALMGDDRGVAGWTLEQTRDPDKRGYTVIRITEIVNS
jgi:hypothetical protein